MDTLGFLLQERDFFRKGLRRSPEERIALLKKLFQALEKNREAVLSALYADLRKSPEEAILSEYAPLLHSIRSTIRQIRRPAVFSGPLWHEPFGLVLVCSTWNYPFRLALEPLIGAVAAGNSVLLKASPQAPVSAHLLGKLLEEAFGGECAMADPGTPFEELLEQRFDFFFFTGGVGTGRKVAAAAARVPAPCVLELGGKNPCIVTGSADLKMAARKIAWGKFFNAGQTCIAPDYLLVHSQIKAGLLLQLREAVESFYGPDPQQSRDYGRIINQQQYDRLCALLSAGRLVCGGEHDPEDRYIAPTVLDDVTWESPVMQQEIFGPLLPVLEYSSPEEAVARINARPKPLALYCFSGDSKEWRSILDSTSSGGAAVNDVMLQAAGGLPFGGVGESGCGAYHGKYTMKLFTHEKAVFKGSCLTQFFRYPPFSGMKKFLIRLLI